MADRIPIRCSKCRARFSIGDKSKVGKRVRCPKCSEVFVARAISKADASTRKRKARSTDDQFEAPKLPPRRSKKVATKKKRPATSAGVKWPLLMIGIALPLALAVGGGVMFFNRGGDDPTENVTGTSAAQTAGDTESLHTSQPLPSDGNPTTPMATTSESSPAANSVQTPARSKKAEKYGESSEVVATNSDNLPEGISGVAGRTRWYWTRALDAAGKRQSVVDLFVDIRGELVSQAIAVGKAEITKVNLVPTQSLAPFESFGDGAGDADRYYDSGGWEQPADAIRMALKFVAPATPAASVSEVEGTITVKVGRLVEEVLIPDMRTAANKPLESPNLRAARAQLFLTKEKFQRNSVDVADFRFSPDYAVGPLNVTSSTFPVSLRRDYKIDPNGFHYSTRHLGNLPPGRLSLTFNLYHDIKEVVVPFRFEDMPLPDFGKQPKS